MASRRDPKEIVTPYAFRVSPELLGLPLGSPWRRAGAILVDLLLIGLLLAIKEVSGALFGIALAYVLWRISSRSATGGVRGGFARTAVRIVAVIVFLASLGSIGSCFVSGPEPPRFRAEREPDGAVVPRPGPGEDGRIGLPQLARGIGAAISLGAARSEAEARIIARELARDLERTGLEPDEVREVLGEMLRESPEKPWAAAVIDSALAALDAPDAPAAEPATGQDPEAARPAGEEAPVTAAPDSLPEAGDPSAAPPPESLEALVAAYDSLFEAGDTASARALRPLLAEAAAGEELSRLRRRADRLEERVREARAEAEEEPGLLGFLRSLLDDLGLGLGWTGLYFTLFLAAWRGQTPGKRLFGLRVVRLNGEALGWWPAFERFGGYAACLATGLLGFLQILWDANRQGLHDRIVGTVVVRTRGPGSRELAPPDRRGREVPPRTPGGRTATGRPGTAAGVATVTRAATRPAAPRRTPPDGDAERAPGARTTDGDADGRRSAE